MMKGGLGNLMRQAQQMQETMQKAQAELADLEVTGESGAGMVKIVLNGRHEAKKVTIEPKLAGEDLGYARRPAGRGRQRCGTQSCGAQPGKICGTHVRNESSARHEAAVLSDRSMKYTPTLARLIDSLRCLPGVGPKSAQRMAFYLLERDRDGGRALEPGAGGSAPAGRTLQALPHAHGERAVRDLRLQSARCRAALRRRIARGRRRHRAIGRLSRPLLRADGASVAARRNRAGRARLG